MYNKKLFEAYGEKRQPAADVHVQRYHKNATATKKKVCIFLLDQFIHDR